MSQHYKKDSKKILIFLLIFTPISILIYAVIAYTLFFKFQKENNNIILSEYKQLVCDEQKKDLIQQINFYKGVYKRHRQNILEMVKTLPPKNNIKIALFDNNGKLLYSNIKNQKLIDDIQLYLNKYEIIENQNFLYLTKEIGPKKYKISVALDKRLFSKRIQNLKERLQKNIKNAILKSFIWLAVVWFIFTLISLYIAYQIYKQMQQYEKKLKDSNDRIVFQSRQAMLGELLPMIAHQWRQPINKIASILMRMRFEILKPEPNSETLDRYCQEIEDSIELMSNTIEDFRGFYRPKEEPEVVEVSTIVRKSIYFLHELLDKKNVSLKQNLQTCYIKLHGNELMQVLINLIKNAYDAIENNGEISISVKEKKNKIIIRVEDNGPGIPPEILDKIFEPHFSTKESSMGLGLYMSKLIVESHFGGTMEAYNTDRGAGFVITLNKNV